MSGSVRFLKRMLSDLRTLYVLIFAGFLIWHVFIFRDVVAATPNIWSGNSVIVREELVPFFNFGTQFWGDDASDLTSSDEVRTGYSFWTAWVRFAPVLPIALVVMNALSAFLLFFAFHIVTRYFSKERPYIGVLASILAAAVIHGILLYAKVAHFYVLIIGFSLFAVAVSLAIEQIFFRRNLSVKNMIVLSLVVLANPAVHYHVIFYLIFTLMLIVHSIFVLVVNRPFFGFYLKKHLIYFFAVLLASLIPYVALIMITTSSSFGSVSTDIPVNYWLIYYSSLGLPSIFSFDTAGHLDLIRYGNYLAPLPRFGSMLITFLAGSVFLFKNWIGLNLVRRLLVSTVFVLMLVSMWMSIGYGEASIFSFHSLLSAMASFFSTQNNWFADSINHGLSLFINILRFPHRFQFIYFYMGGLLFVLALVWLHDIFMRRFGKRLVAIGLIILVALLPLYASGDYRTALASGDLATFASPYRIPNDLVQIKQMLAQNRSGKLFILPSMESGREIAQDGKTYTFLDKFFIYYLDTPTLYYGVGASTQNKIISYLVYRSISFHESWWQDVLANNLGVSHILVPKHVEARKVGITYLPGIEQSIDKALAASTRYHKVYDGSDYTLYELDQKALTYNASLIDLSWNKFVDFAKAGSLSGLKFDFPLQLTDFSTQQNGVVVTDNPERSFYNLYVGAGVVKKYQPDSVLLPFDSRLVASSNFTNDSLSLSTLYAADDDYNYLHEVVPSLAGLLAPQFVGLTQGDSTLDISFNVPTSGNYRLLLHGGSRGDKIQANLGGQQVEFKKLAGDTSTTNYIDLTYFYTDVSLVAGQHKLQITNTDQNAVVAETLTPMPADQVPKDFTNAQTSKFKISPTGNPNELSVQFGGIK